MSEQEPSQEPEEREETIDDLDVPEDDAENVEGGIKRGIDSP
jgi:hypothetical protein